MRVFEAMVAALLVIAGIRSLVKWSGRRFEAVDATDHALYALFVTGRVGLWFAFAGFFAIYASVESQGRAALDELEQYRWYLIVPLVLSGFQLVGGWFLGRRIPPES
ncbi:MAG: hypothetical protein WD965_06705 [Actinomycetota bacterium]